jgi:signal transduction histidine kinase
MLLRSIGRFSPGLLALAAFLLCGCRPSDEDVAQERLDLASRAAVVVHADLEDMVGRLFAAVREAEEALASTGAEGRGIFDTLADLQRRTGVDGLLWEGPGAGRGWAGQPVEPLVFPPPPPWRESFRQGDLIWHAGPYRRALVAGPFTVRGGVFTASVVVEERAPEEQYRRVFERKWLEPLGVERVDILPPFDETQPVEGAQSFQVADPEGNPVLRVVVTPPGPGAVADRLERKAAGGLGVVLLIVWAAALFTVLYVGRRKIPRGAGRWLLAGLLVLVARTALGWIDMAGRFALLERAFNPADFGIEDPFGWLATPGDFAITAAAFLLAAGCFARAVERMGVRGSRVLRASAVVCGVGTAAAVSALWMAVVETAVAQGQTDFFAAPEIIPSLPAALMLTGLVVATAAAWVLTVAALRVIGFGWPRLRALPWAALPALAALLVAVALTQGAHPVWAPAVLPLAALLAFLRPRGGEATAPPGRAFLIGVLATIILFPLLWQRVGARRAESLPTVLDELLSGEAIAISSTLLDLGAIADDEELRKALAEARRGPVPEGIALDVWMRSFLASTGADGLVSVLGPEGRLLDEFTLTSLPRDRVPRPAPPVAGAGDLEMLTPPSDGRRVRCVVGRLTLRDDREEVLGSVVITVPDPVDLALLRIERGPGPSLAPRDRASAPLQLALIRGARVEASSDPSISRQTLDFGPRELERVGPDNPELGWYGEKDGYAVWSPERKVTIAIRRRAAGVGDALLALARLVVVGVGLACLAAVVLLVATVRRLHRRLHARILLSYFAISFTPIVVLGWASAQDARTRHDTNLSHRLEVDVRRTRTDLEAMGPQVFDRASDAHLVKWANLRGHEVLVYRDGRVYASSRAGLVEAELIGSRLPADAYRATVLERREIVRKQTSIAGRPVWFGYAPVIDATGRTLATVGVPMLYDPRGIEERFAVTGSVLLAAYLLTLVLVLVGGLWAARRIARPLGLLAAGTRRVAAGELDTVLPPAGSDELGELVRAFNTMTRELKEATARAVRAERETAWRRMARQVAHEIKNPLTPIRLMIQQMEADVARDPERALDAIRRTAPVVLRQIEALGQIAADFAHFARLPRRTMADVDVPALVEDVVALHSGSAREGVAVTALIADDVPLTRWDAEEIRRVLLNMVGNAVQATKADGTVTVHVSGETRAARDGVRVEVVDTGIGILPEHRARIFEPDFSTKTSGTGLGLAMVRRTLDDMGGTIDVESTPGEGSTFRLWWPARPATT